VAKVWKRGVRSKPNCLELAAAWPWSQPSARAVKLQLSWL